MHQIIFTVDKQLNITYWNDTANPIKSTPLSESYGHHYYEVIPKICVGDFDAVSEVVKDGKPIVIKGYKVGCFYGGVEADIYIEPDKDASENIRGARVTIENIKGCSMLQELQQLQPIIDIGKIASTLAHGVRNPLNAIKGAVVYLKDKYAGEKTLLEFSEIMEEEISRLDNFITKFLSISIFDGNLSDTDLNSLIKKIEIFTSFQSYANNIDIICDYGTVPPLCINGFQVEQAILNIINNSIEAMPSGGCISIETKAERCCDKDFAVIKISDTGPGMGNPLENDTSPLIRDRIKEAGKGFGLFITREVIQYHGGHLEIMSEKGIGTTFKIFLPVNK